MTFCFEGMKANDKQCLQEELDKLSEYEKRHFKIIRLPKKEQWHVYGPPDWIYEIVKKQPVIEKRDIVCPLCAGMLDDIEYSKNLFCPFCNIEWVI